MNTKGHRHTAKSTKQAKKMSVSNNKELQNLIREQQKDRSSSVINPEIIKTTSINFFSENTIEEILNIINSAGLSDKETLCWIAVVIIRWPKLRFSRVIKEMGKSHTATNKYLKSAGNKLFEFIKKNGIEQERNKDNSSEPEELTISEEVAEQFKSFGTKNFHFNE